MFSRIEARRFRSLKTVDQDLGRFHALVGPNASGKTTFLDVMSFLSDLVRNRGDVWETTKLRSATFEDLLWLREGTFFQLAVEAKVPEHVVAEMADDRRHLDFVRYEIEVGADPETGEVGLNHETLWLRSARMPQTHRQREMFPAEQGQPYSLLKATQKGFRTSIKKTQGGNDIYYTEGKRRSYNPSFRLGRSRSALANIPADEQSFPVSSWFRGLLEGGINTFVLNSQTIKRPSPPGQGTQFKVDGSNLPWVVAELKKDIKRFNRWLDHVRTALDDIKDVSTIERPEDRHRYLVIEYANGAKVPSWLVSDGTLRLLALTIPAYLKDLRGVFLIEEPENGVHPRAIETVLQSLASMYESQVLIATHSPIALGMLKPSDVLCFAKDVSGATDIVPGNEHPALRNWQTGKPDFGVLFASGILS
jgi:predicted ATPase